MRVRETGAKSTNQEMAGKNTSAKKGPGTVGKLYLKAYNLLQTLGWSYILYKFLCHDHFHSDQAHLWQSVILPVMIFQNAAVLEAVHIILGLVPSNLMVTILQVASRVIIVCGVLLATPETYAASSFGLSLCMVAWSITEIIRYLYYFMNLINFIPYPLLWLRYTLFIILYPIGITGELLCLYSATLYARANPEAYSYLLPNSWNFTFNYFYLLAIIMFTYIPVFPHLYMHMFSQRRKLLGGRDSQKKER